jgi:flagellar biosynthesis protein FlhG
MGNQVESLVKLIKSKGRGTSGKVISFASGKGGVGKTGISTSLAFVLSNTFNKRVLLLDCDVGLGNVHLLLGLSPDKSLKSVLRGTPIEKVIQEAFGFDVVLGFSGIDSVDEIESLETANLLLQLERVLQNYDYIILDNSAGLNRYTIGFSRAAETTYLITTPEPTALTDAYAFIKSMYRLYGYTSFKVVVNMAKSKREGFETFERLQGSANRFLGIDLKLAGIVPFSNRFKDSLRERKPLTATYPSDPFSLEIKRIAQLETGELYREREEGFLKRVLKFLFEGD